ncbi:MAG TPA: BACON domain-containing carbohydrate-binding protein [Bryobacteraceae bacterium]|nr:BACON domain-containing carbohydrate-binding protein [Bryobacteraceae bacterium]
MHPQPRIQRCALGVLVFAPVLLAQQAELGPPLKMPERVVSVPIATGPATPQVQAAFFDTTNRANVAAFYNSTLVTTRGLPIGWTGSVTPANPGTTLQSYKDAVAVRVNWFRTMAGVPATITLNTTYNTKDQQAALMMSANNQLNHTPPSSWIDYTADGAEAAGNSNLCGYFGSWVDTGCVELYIQDGGSNNEVVGHRRWIIYPQTQQMGTGDVPQNGSSSQYMGANALWVIDSNYGGTRPATRDGFVAWPPPGYVPYTLVFPRWSFAYPNADFSAATVTMMRNGSSVPVSVKPPQNLYGENTLVWVPDNLDPTVPFNPTAPASDTPITVTVSGIRGAPQSSYTYVVTVFDPNAGSCSYSLSGNNFTAPAGGASGTVTVTTSAGCSWTAVSNVPWIIVTGGQSGSGPASLTVLANNTGAQRVGTLTIAGQTVTMTQAGGSACNYSLPSTSASFASSAGTGTVSVQATPSNCSWTAVSNATWITVAAGANGAGNGSVSYSVTANTGAFRTGTMTIAGVTFTVSQSGTVTKLAFFPVTPCRILDTRNPSGPFGGPILAGNASRDVSIPQSSCGIPASAQAYSLNVTVVPPGRLTYLSIWPSGQPQPVVSTLNSFDGQVVANAALVPAGTNGAISVYVSDSTHVIIDINGYFAPPSAQGLAFYPVTPCRVADTRLSTGTFGGPRMPGGSIRTFPIPASLCSGIPPSAQAFSLNMTAVPPAPLTYLTAWPSGQNQPVVSTLNSFNARVVANAAIVPAGTSGGVNVFVSDATDVIIDINGYFAPPGASGALYFYPAIPCRVADTRGAVGPFGGPSMAGNATRNFAISNSSCGVPPSALAFSLNMTVVPPAPLTYLTTWPQGGTMPVVSTLNSFNATVVANAAIVPAGSGGISVYVSNATDLIIDVNGYFAP